LQDVLDATDQWFSPGTPVSSTIKTDRHNITEVLMKVALNTNN
jgi:cobalamin-dependent methionine synthase I